MSIAAVTEAIDTFRVNDEALRDLILAKYDTQIAEAEMEKSQIVASIEARINQIRQAKQSVHEEFGARARDLVVILEGKA